ncbi:elongator complex protein 2 [Adelges cooleyi]|uniref:elongator complex protein 2 n=1 Tax=Adelges cooleyi TaxID=133065 RepID=UPI00217FEF74|nr:elongator complex protein 2 [Adelges cooleyi]
MEETNQQELVESVYVSSAVNSSPHCLDWGTNGLVIFGSCNAVHMYDPRIDDHCDGLIVSTFLHHTKRVNSVKWIQQASNNSLAQDFVSCSADNSAVLWEGVQPTGYYKRKEKLVGHSDVVTSSDAIRLLNDSLYIVTTSGDCTVKIWVKSKDECDCQCFQTLDFKNVLCISVKIAILPYTNCLLLACGLSNSKIQLCISNFSNGKSGFISSHTLDGHEDWVRALDFISEENTGGGLFLASGSQDSMIRLWKFTTEENTNDSTSNEETLQLEQKKINVSKQDGSNLVYVIQTESVISGHDGWIYGVNWKSKSCSESKLELLSVSMDKTLAVWAFDDNSGLWIDFVRLGEVGGNTLGFYGGKFSPDGQCILAQGHDGSFHLWKKNKEDGGWSPEVTIGGHFGSVEDIAWEPEGRYLVSVSFDQTTRLHAQWLKSSESNNISNWHEMARPQVHGYNMSSVVMLSSLSFASSAEEKVIRVFQAPYNFLENMSNLGKIQFPPVDIANSPLGASVPSLGLSNKAVSGEDCKNMANQKTKKDYPEHYFVPLTLSQPPTEEDLVQNTLWPEIQKLYGHGYEVYCLASSPDSKWVASAAKATSVEHAAIIIWNTNGYQQVQKLVSHNLTVTQLAFSPDSTKLVSVSRDRTWTLFKYNAESCLFSLVFKSNKQTGIHTRIIWCCAWSHDSSYFATGSRDGKLVVWDKSDRCETGDDTKELYCPKSDPLIASEESFTSVAFAPTHLNNESAYLMAIGCDSGRILLYKWNSEDKSTTAWFELANIFNELGHHLTVKKLVFQPLLNKKDVRHKDGVLRMASCGADMMVRIYNVFIKHL